MMFKNQKILSVLHGLKNLETQNRCSTTPQNLCENTALLPGPCFNTGLGFPVDNDIISDYLDPQTTIYKWLRFQVQMCTQNGQIIESYRIQFSRTAQQKTETKQPQKSGQFSETRFFQHLPTPDVSSFWIPSTHNSTSCAGCTFGMASDRAKSSRRAACRTATALASPAVGTALCRWNVKNHVIPTIPINSWPSPSENKG